MVKYIKANEFSNIVNKRLLVASKLKAQIVNLLREYGLYYDVGVVMQEPIETSNRYVAYIQIIDGDWKYEHTALDALIGDSFNVVDKYEEVTDKDDSDTYSSVHKYSIEFI